MKSITITYEDDVDAVLPKKHDHVVVVVVDTNAEPICESRVFGSQVLVPRIPSSFSKDTYLKEAIVAAVGIVGNKDCLYQTTIKWPNGDWGIVIDVETERPSKAT